MNEVVNSLKFQSIYYILSQVIDRFMTFLFVILLTHSSTLTQFGKWNQFQTTNSIAVAIFSSGLSTFIIQNSKAIQTKLKQINFLKFIMINLLILSLFFIFSQVFNSKIGLYVFGTDQYSLIVSILFMYIFSEIFLELGLSVTRSFEKIIFNSNIYILKIFSKLIITLFFINNFFVNFDTFLILFFISSFLIYVIVILYIFKYLNNYIFEDNFRKINYISAFKSVLLLSLMSFIYSGIIFQNRFFITHFLGLESVGLFSLNFNIASMLAILYTSIGYTLFPRLANMDKNAVKANFIILSKALQFYFVSILVFVLFNVLIGIDLISIFIDSKFYLDKYIIFILSIGIFLFGVHQILTYYLLILNLQLKIFYILLLVFFLTIPTTYFAVKYFEIFGATLTFLFSNLMLTVATIKMFQVKTNIRLNLFDCKFNRFIIIVSIIYSIMLPLMLNEANIGIKFFYFIVFSLFIIISDIYKRNNSFIRSFNA